MTMKSKCGQSYLIDIENTSVAYNSAQTEEIQAFLDTFISEEKVIVDVETAYDIDGAIQVTFVPSNFFQQELLDGRDEIDLYDNTSTGTFMNAVYHTNRPYFMPIIASLNNYMWTVTRQLHKPMLAGQIEYIRIFPDEWEAGSFSSGASPVRIIQKHDVGCKEWHSKRKGVK